MIQKITFALVVLFAAVANADEPVRVGITDSAAAPAMRQSPAVRVAALVDSITSRSVSRSAAVPVFRDEAQFVSEANLPHHGHHYSNRYGYQPGCCENVGYTDGLWAGYCETRHSHWMHGTWFMRAFGGNCCDSCETAKK